jgi:hypothetical protein
MLCLMPSMQRLVHMQGMLLHFMRTATVPVVCPVENPVQCHVHKHLPHPCGRRLCVWPQNGTGSRYNDK